MDKTLYPWIGALLIAVAVLAGTADNMSAEREQIATAADDCDRAGGLWIDTSAECVFPEDQPRRVAQNEWSDK